MPDQREPSALQARPPATGQQQAESAWLLGGRYRVLDRLGLGGMAEVFRAHDELLDRDVAVKVFRTPMAGDDDTHGAVRRELELQSLARLSHPNLITLFDGSVAGEGPAYLVLELVNGPDLASRLREGPLPEPEARAIGAQIADALAYVHARGMVHRDVKPANILLGVDDALPGSVRPRLSDFGIVRMIGSERMTSVDMTLGTASYVAPEQAKGADVGPAADVYALALVLIESLTGVRCFGGPVHEALAARLTTAPQIPPGLPAPWPELLAAMTVQDPDDRPDAAEVARSLREGVPPAVSPVAEVPAEMSPTTANAAVAAAGLVAAAAVPAAAGAATPVNGAVPTGAAALSTAAVAAAPTGPLVPVSAGAFPAAVAPAGMTGPPGGPPPTYPPWDDEPYVGDPRRGRRTAGVLVAAATFVALLAAAGFLLLGGSPSAPADTSTTTSPTTHPATSSKSPAKHTKASQAAQVGSTTTRSSSTSHHASRSATSTRSAATATSAAPRTSSSASSPVTSSSVASSSASSVAPSSPPASPPAGTDIAAGAVKSPSPTP